MSQDKQPISPHLSVYKWQVTNTLSILHRFSGVILFLAAFDLAIWFVSIVLGNMAKFDIVYIITPVVIRPVGVKLYYK